MQEAEIFFWFFFATDFSGSFWGRISSGKFVPIKLIFKPIRLIHDENSSCLLDQTKSLVKKKYKTEKLQKSKISLLLPSIKWATLLNFYELSYWKSSTSRTLTIDICWIFYIAFFKSISHLYVSKSFNLTTKKYL